MWLKKIFFSIPALIGSIVYALFPYHVYDIYTRGSVGEAVALSIIPFIFWQIERGKNVFIAIGIGLLITAHNVLAILFLPIILLYMIILRRCSISSILFVFIEGLSMSSFFWMPALYDRQFTVFDMTVVSDFSHYFISDISLFGIITIITLAISIYLIFRKLDIKLTFFLILTLLSIFLATSISKFIWQILPLGPFIQFPFRMLSFSVLSISFLVGYILQKSKRKYLIIGSVISLVILYASSWMFFTPKKTDNLPDSFYSTNQDSTTVQNEYMPRWVKTLPNPTQNQQVSLLSGQGEVSNVFKNGARMSFDFQAVKPSAIETHIMYFPGWKVFVDNKKTPLTYSNSYGLIDFDLPSGFSHVKMVFEETSFRITADCVTLIGILILLLFPLYKKRLSL